MAVKETYYYGQGRVSLAVRNDNGTRGPYVWVGDVSVFTPKFDEDKVEHKESYSGQKATARSFSIGAAGTIDMTWHQLSPENLAILLRGNVVAGDGGDITGEVLGSGLAEGDEVRLAQPFASDVVITDSTGATLEEGVDYVIDADFGRITLGAIGSFTQPLKASYSYGETSSVGIFAAAAKNYAILFEGVNLAESNAPVVAEYYNCTIDALSELALITDGTDVAGVSTTANVERDGARPLSGPLGNMGRITQKNTSAKATT